MPCLTCFGRITVVDWVHYALLPLKYSHPLCKTEINDLVSFMLC